MAEIINTGSSTVIIGDAPSAGTIKRSAGTIVNVGLDEGLPGAAGPAGPAGLSTRGHRLATNPDINHLLYYFLNEAAAPFVNSGSVANQSLVQVTGTKGDPYPNQFNPWGNKDVLFNGWFVGGAGQLNNPLTTVKPNFPITWEAWYRPVALGASGGDQVIVVKKESVSTGYTIRIMKVLTTNRPSLDIRTDNAGGTDYSIAPLSGSSPEAVFTAFQWHHIGLTYDGAHLALYFNGLFIRQIVAIGNLVYNNLDIYQIGDQDAVAGCQGLIWDVALSNIARPESYFRAVYEAGMGWTP